MEITKTSVLRFGTLLLQAAALLKFLCLLVSFLRSQTWSWKRPQGHGDSSEQKLGVMRCKWIRRFACISYVLSMFRLISRQAMRHNEDKFDPELDLNVLVAATCSLLLISFPGLLNPRNQDIIYVVWTFLLDASYLIPPVKVDVRDMIAFSFPGRFICGVLARRTSASAFCMLLHLLQAVLITRLQGLQEDSAGTDHYSQAVFALFWMFLSILFVRRLIHENVLLKVNLQKRSVELGAVSSLLTPCYDAVVELDQCLKLTQDPWLFQKRSNHFAHAAGFSFLSSFTMQWHQGVACEKLTRVIFLTRNVELVAPKDSGQLSSMLLQTAPKVGGLAGKSMLDFFSEGDRKRISEQMLNPVESVSVVALNADMLDSDFNHVKVELFCTQFKNFAK